MKVERIGIVVIGRNEGERLLLCLDSAISSGLPVVYVDSQSTDTSVAEATKRGIDTILLDSSLPLSAARARNEGFYRLIETFPLIEFVHFIDADCELDSSWLSSAIEVLDKQETIAVVSGRLREKYRNTSVYMKLCDMGWYKPTGFIDACGGIATYRRNVFESLSGFKGMLISGEEPELCLRVREAGWQVLSLDVEMGTHDSAMTRFPQWWTRCVKVGFGYMNGFEWGGYSKQYKSTLFWAGLPFFIVLLVLITSSSVSLLLFLLYPIQVFRIFKKVSGNNLSRKDRFIYAIFCMLSKFPESQGIMTYFLNKISSKNKVIQYK